MEAWLGSEGSDSQKGGLRKGSSPVWVRILNSDENGRIGGYGVENGGPSILLQAAQGSSAFPRAHRN